MERRAAATGVVVLAGAATALGICAVALSAGAGGVGVWAWRVGPGDLLWARRIGERFTDRGGSLALDAAGNLLLAGVWPTPSSPPEPGRTPEPEHGLFVVALGPVGAELWTSRFATSEAYDPDRLHLGAGGGALWLAGALHGKAAFDRVHEGGDGPAAFLAKLSDAGRPVWSASWAKTTAHRVAAAPDGGVVLGGRFTGTVSLGGAPLHSTGEDAGFLARFDAAGRHVWSAVMPPFFELAVDASANVYAAGWYEGKLSHGAATVTSRAGGSDVFVLSLTPAGAPRWLGSVGSEGHDVRVRIAVDPSGSATIAWNVSTADASPHSGGQLQVARLDPGGKKLWERTLGGTGTEARLRGVAVAADGSAAITGTFFDTIDVGTGPLTAAPSTKAAFVARLAADGTTRWARRLAAARSAYVEAADVLIDAAGRVCASGWFSRTLDLGPRKLTSAGGEDAYVVCYAP